MLAQRLNEIITLLGASTSDLAGFAGCTASNISRIRSGARIPRHGGIAAERLINGLYLLADDRGQLPGSRRRCAAPWRRGSLKASRPHGRRHGSGRRRTRRTHSAPGSMR